MNVFFIPNDLWPIILQYTLFDKQALSVIANLSLTHTHFASLLSAESTILWQQIFSFFLNWIYPHKHYPISIQQSYSLSNKYHFLIYFKTFLKQSSMNYTNSMALEGHSGTITHCVPIYRKLFLNKSCHTDAVFDIISSSADGYLIHWDIVTGRYYRRWNSRIYFTKSKILNFFFDSLHHTLLVIIIHQSSVGQQELTLIVLDYFSWNRVLQMIPLTQRVESEYSAFFIQWFFFQNELHIVSMNQLCCLQRNTENETWHICQQFDYNEDTFTCASICATQTVMSCGTINGKVILFDLKNYNANAMQKVHSDTVYSIAMNETYICTSSYDQSWKICNYQNLKLSFFKELTHNSFHSIYKINWNSATQQWMVHGNAILDSNFKIVSWISNSNSVCDLWESMLVTANFQQVIVYHCKAKQKLFQVEDHTKSVTQVYLDDHILLTIGRDFVINCYGFRLNSIPTTVAPTVPQQYLLEMNSTAVEKDICLVMIGALNPLHKSHLRCLQLAKEYFETQLQQQVNHQIYCPIADGYRKYGLLWQMHRVNICKLSEPSIQVHVMSQVETYGQVMSDIQNEYPTMKCIEVIGMETFWNNPYTYQRRLQQLNQSICVILSLESDSNTTNPFEYLLQKSGLTNTDVETIQQMIDDYAQTQLFVICVNEELLSMSSSVIRSYCKRQQWQKVQESVANLQVLNYLQSQQLFEDL